MATLSLKSSQGVAAVSHRGLPAAPVAFGTANGPAVQVVVGLESLTAPLGGERATHRRRERLEPDDDLDRGAVRRAERDGRRRQPAV
ncbi:MAG: hypothetical protein ACXV3V_03575, partial [Actinomycetes bacterium]